MYSKSLFCKKASPSSWVCQGIRNCPFLMSIAPVPFINPGGWGWNGSFCLSLFSLVRGFCHWELAMCWIEFHYRQSNFWNISYYVLLKTFLYQPGWYPSLFDVSVVKIKNINSSQLSGGLCFVAEAQQASYLADGLCHVISHTARLQVQKPLTYLYSNPLYNVRSTLFGRVVSEHSFYIFFYETRHKPSVVSLKLAFPLAAVSYTLSPTSTNLKVHLFGDMRRDFYQA